MEWWEVEIACTPDVVETAAAVLQEWPEVQGVLYDGYVPSEPLHPEYGEWFAQELTETQADAVGVKVYLPGWLEGAAVTERIEQALDQLTALGIQRDELMPSIKQIDESGWAQVWEQEFQPIDIGSKLTIVPTSQRNVWENAARNPIYLDPGRAFGTGSHATTQLCLELLEPLIRKDVRVLDVGCGTGVLSIAAVKLGAGEVTAVDVDPVAVEVTKENAEINGVTTGFQAMQSDLLSSVGVETYDIVLANILRDVVIRLSSAVVSRMVQNGRLIASGFLEGDVETVTEALEKAGLRVKEVAAKDQWAAVLAVKPQ